MLLVGRDPKPRRTMTRIGFSYSLSLTAIATTLLVWEWEAFVSRHSHLEESLRELPRAICLLITCSSNDLANVDRVDQRRPGKVAPFTHYEFRWN